MTDQEGVYDQNHNKNGANGPENAVFGGEKVAAKGYLESFQRGRAHADKLGPITEAAIYQKAKRYALKGTRLTQAAIDVLTGLQLILWVYNRENVGISKTEFWESNADGRRDYKNALRQLIRQGYIDEFPNRSGKKGSYYDIADSGRRLLERFDAAADMIEEDMRDRRRQRIEKAPGTKDRPKRYRRPAQLPDL